MSDQALADAALRVAQNWPSLLREAVERIADLQRQLAEAEAREAELRGAAKGITYLFDALAHHYNAEDEAEYIEPFRAALALPHDGSALAAAAERARSEERTACIAAIEEMGRAREALVHDVDHAAARADCARAIEERGRGCK